MLVHSYYLVDPRVRREAEALVATGHDVDVLALAETDEPAEANINGVRVIRLPVRRHRGRSPIVYLAEYIIFMMLCSAKLLADLPTARYNLVQVHNPPDFLVFAAVIPRLLGSRVILDVHDFMSDGFMLKTGKKSPARMLRLAEWLSWRFVDHLITVHKEYKQIIVGRGIPPEKVMVVMNLPDDRLFHGQALSRDPWSESEHFKLVYHGTLADRYGLEVAIRAVKALVSRIPNLRFEVYGDGDARVRLKELVVELRLEDHVWFSEGMADVESLPDRLSRANLAVVPTLKTELTDLMLPTKLMEYVALGIPAVVSRTRTVCAYFDETMVRFFTPGDPEDLASAILDLYQHPEEAARLRSNARQFSSTYSWSKTKQTYVGLVDQMVGQAQCGAAADPVRHTGR